MPTGGGAGGRANSAPTRKRKRAATPLTAAMDRNTDLRSARSDPARIMVFWSPMAIVVRNQRMFSSIMLNVIQAQQHWARALQRLGTGIDISDPGSASPHHPASPPPASLDAHHQAEPIGRLAHRHPSRPNHVPALPLAAGAGQGLTARWEAFAM